MRSFGYSSLLFFIFIFLCWNFVLTSGWGFIKQSISLWLDKKEWDSEIKQLKVVLYWWNDRVCVHFWLPRKYLSRVFWSYYCKYMNSDNRIWCLAWRCKRQEGLQYGGGDDWIIGGSGDRRKRERTYICAHIGGRRTYAVEIYDSWKMKKLIEFMKCQLPTR